MTSSLTRAPDKKTRLLAWVVFSVTLLVLVAAGRTQGNTRDEGYYFDAAELYYGWYGELGENLLKGQPQKSFTRASVDRWFGYNHEHPALMKTLFGLSWRAFHRCKCVGQPGHSVGYAKKHATLGLLSEQEALRLPTNLSVAWMAALVFLFGAMVWSRGAGLVAAVLTVGMPRLFFDAELAAFDAPIAALWLATVYAYFRALEEPKWAWRAGAIFGLGLATKHNAFFIPFVLLLHYLWMHRATLKKFRLPPIPRVFVMMATLGPLVYLACWPWLWFSTVARFREYVGFHVNHVYYNMEYLGVNYNKPPFPIGFPYVMTLFTTPLTTVILAMAGSAALIAAWRRARNPALAQTVEIPIGMWEPPAPKPTAPGFLVALNAIFPMAIITLTRAPIFGATKHWHAALPFIALLAGCGFHVLARALPGATERRRLFATLLFGVVVCAPAVAETWRSHPYGLTHYGMLAGGPPGGADLGMNRQFWGYATRGILPWLNQNAPRSAPIYWHDTNQAQLNMNLREGMQRADLRNTGLEEPGVKSSDLAMVIHEKHFNKYEYWIWDFYGTAKPVLVLDVEGVPVVTLYQRGK